MWLLVDNFIFLSTRTMITTKKEEQYIQINVDYNIEYRINPERIELYNKNMETWEFSYLEEKFTKRQLENNNLYFLVNWYLWGKREEKKLRKIFAFWFDIDNVKEFMSEEEVFKRLEEIEEYYWLRAHIINKTSGWYHIYYLLEATPYKIFEDEIDKIYDTLVKELNADVDFTRKIWVLKVVWSYDFRGKKYIENIRNEFHNRYKITDFNKVLWNDICKRYEKVNLKKELNKIDEEEKTYKRKYNTYVYKINSIPFSSLVEKLKLYWCKVKIVNKKVIIEWNEKHGKAISYFPEEDRVLDFKRKSREKQGENSRWANYWFLNYIFYIIERQKLDKVWKSDILVDKDIIRTNMRIFLQKYFNIQSSLDPQNYININLLIFI